MFIALRFSSLFLTLAVVSFGCGDDDDDGVTPDPPDASTADAAADAAPSVDADVNGKVTVELLEAAPWEVPDTYPEGVPVLFFGPDGELVDEVATNAEGKAEAEIVPGSTVLAIFPPSPQPLGISSVGASFAFDVAPGDVVAFRPGGEFREELGDMTLTAPANPPQGTSEYVFDNGCDASRTSEASEAMTFDHRCVVSDEVDVIVTAVDSSNVALAYAWASAPFVANGDLAIDGAWETPQAFEVTVPSLPQEVAAIGVALDAAFGERTYMGTDWEELEATDTASLAHPGQGFGDSRIFYLEAASVQNALGLQVRVERLALDATEREVTDSQPLLPFYTAPIWSADSKTMSWIGTGGDQPDLMGGAIYWEGEKSYGLFTVVVPGDATSFQLPNIPAKYASALPSATDSVYPDLSAFESSTIESYRDALAVPVADDQMDSPGLGFGQYVRASFAGGGLRSVAPTGPMGSPLPARMTGLMKVGDRLRVAYGASGIGRVVPSTPPQPFKVARPRVGQVPTIR